MPNEQNKPVLHSNMRDVTETPMQRLHRILEDPETLDRICDNVANGGSLTELSTLWQVPYHKLCNWINADTDRNKTFAKAMLNRDEWMKEIVLREVRSIATADIRELYDDNNNLKPVKEWPDHIARAVEGITVDEIYEGRGAEREHIGDSKSVRLAKKDKLLIALGKQVGLFKDKVEHSADESLEAILTRAHKRLENNE